MENYFTKNFGHLRSVLKLTQEELAKSLGISDAWISKLEKNPSVKASKQLIKSICSTYGINPDWLTENKGDMFLTPPEPPKTAKVEEPKNGYDPQGGWKPSLKGPEYELLGLAFEVIRSDTTYATALSANIRAFHQAVESQKKEIEQNGKIEDLQKLCKPYWIAWPRWRGETCKTTRRQAGVSDIARLALELCSLPGWAKLDNTLRGLRDERCDYHCYGNVIFIDFKLMNG